MDKRYASSGPGEKYSITGISRIPEAGSSLRRKENSRHPCSSFITERRSVGSSIAFTAKFPTCLITSQISLRRYHFLDIFSPFFFSSLSIFFFHSPSPCLSSLFLSLSFSIFLFSFLYPRLLCHRGGFRMSAMFDESGRSVRVLLDTF